VQAVLEEDAEDDRLQLVLEVTADGDQQDAIGIVPVLMDAVAIDDVVASNARMLVAWCKRRRLGTA